jgi:ABC-type phosphate transport system substrate-binding protein
MGRIAILIVAFTTLMRGALALAPIAPLASPASPGGADPALAIIVNQSNPLENCSMDELRKIFMGERSHWPNGRRITLVMMDPSQPERKAVLRDIYGMSEKDFNNHFIQGVFTGSVLVSPKTLATSTDVRKFVFNVPGAIGYVKSTEADSTVKVLRIDGRLPDDKDYRLHLQSHAGK